MSGAGPLRFVFSAREGIRSLYAAAGRGGGAAKAYFLLAAGSPPDPKESLDMAAAWRYPGAFILSEEELALPLETLAKLLKLEHPVADQRALAWVRPGGATPEAQLLQLSATGGDGAVLVGAEIELANLALFIPEGNQVTVTEDGLLIDPGRVRLQRGRQSAYDLPPETEVAIDLASGAPGRCCFGAAWQAYELFAQIRDKIGSGTDPHGGELRYFRNDDKGRVVQNTYPLFPPVEVNGPGNVLLHLDVELDPLAPFDADRTRLLFQEAPGLVSSFASTPSGDEVTLTPLVASRDDRAGFYLGRRLEEEGAPGTYLAPFGPFAIDFPKGGRRIMCGLSGLEFVEAAPGDRLVFVPGQAAYAPGGRPLAAKVPTDSLLDSTYTTSWVRLLPAGGSAKRTYFGQPDASTSYGRGVITGEKGDAMSYPAAVASRVRDLSATSPGAFPMVPYGGALEPADDRPPPSLAHDLATFEGAVLAPERGARMRSGPLGRAAADLAGPPSPVFADAAGKPLAGGTTSTPQGFVVSLNAGDEPGRGDAGTWREVSFARSGEQWLTLAADTSGVVDPWMATSLVKDQLFLVVSDWSKLPGMRGALSAGGFEFELVPTASDPEPSQTVLVFKFSTSKSLEELVSNSAEWYASERFVGGEPEVAAAQRVLQQALDAAKEPKAPSSTFAHFRDVVATDPGWTGLLSFNGLIPGTNLPADLQMLYAGMDKPLRAHHFGVELNRVERKGAEAEIAESSLFGVVHYSNQPWKEPVDPPAGEAVPQPEFEFALRELSVAIRNSAVADFRSSVLVRANRLFGREVSLTPPSKPANAITLDGRYQVRGSVGTVTFSEPKAATYEITGAPTARRVLAGMDVSGASLAPVASVAKQGRKGTETEITAEVTLAGSLMFAAEPVERVPLDLFSYGPDPGQDLAAAPGRGVGISGFGLKLSCTLYGDGTKTPTVIVPDLSAVVVGDNREAAREEGLVKKLPLTLKDLLHAEDGLDVGKLGALPLNVPQLAGPSGAVTPKPRYALRFNLPMGSLGGLADAQASLEATLILGWGPSSYSPDDDGIAVFVQLPFISAGAFGFNLQGLLKTTFGDANLMRVEPPGQPATYVVLFNNVALSILGLRFPPRVISNFILFAGPGTGGRGNLGWSLAATEPGQTSAAEIGANA